MENIELENFSLQEYDEKNREHKSTLIHLSNCADFIHIGEVYFLEEHFSIAKKNGKPDALYIAYIGDIPIGMIGSNVMDDNYYLMYSISPEFRGYHYSAALASEYARYLFKMHPEIDQVCASINQSNIASIKNARRAGFVKTTATRYVSKRM